MKNFLFDVLGRFQRISALIKLSLAAIAMGTTLGCSHTATYNKGYVPSEALSVPKKLEGKALIFTVQEDDARNFKGNPASFTGNATTLELPLGVMTREIAGIVFAGMFEGGVEKSNSLDNLAEYSLALTPKWTGFEYAYNQAKNLGFAITPQAQIKLHVKLTDPLNQTFYENTYESGIADGGTYMISGSPAEKINQVVHKILYEQMKRASLDVYREQRLHSLDQLKGKKLITGDEYEAQKKLILEAK